MYVDLELPPGVFRNGTQRQSRGRYYDANLVRWYEGWLGPIGGWQAHSSSLAGQGARAVLTWIDNAALRWIAVGTPTKLWIYNRAGTQYDITPPGLVAGHVDATVGGGFGNGPFGRGLFGTPRTDTTNVQDCTVWTLDTFGQYLVGCNADDGTVYEWRLDTGTPAAALPSTTGTAPTNNRAVMVTSEGFILVLGAGGNPRLVQWPDQRTDGIWTPSTTNQAGFYQLQTPGRLMSGKRIRGGALLFTDQDVQLATYIGPPFIYGFEQVGTGCGIVSQGAVVIAGGNTAYWMSRDGFWSYNGAVQPLESEVGGYVFSRLNTNQRSKVFAVHNPSFGEVDWYYPSTNSLEIDSYVRYNYREGHWAIGSLVRTCGIEAGAFLYPLMCDDTGMLWEHEVGASNYSGATPYAETGPLETGPGGGLSGSPLSPQAPGATTMDILGLIPDAITLGDAELTLFGKFYDTDDDEVFGPYPLENPTDIRACARQFRARWSFNPGSGGIGISRFDLQMGSGR